MNNQNKNIDLKYQQTISVVSGRPKGIECYETQIKNIVENDLNITELKFTIVFPDNTCWVCLKLSITLLELKV